MRRTLVLVLLFPTALIWMVGWLLFSAGERTRLKEGTRVRTDVEKPSDNLNFAVADIVFTKHRD